MEHCDGMESNSIEDSADITFPLYKRRKRDLLLLCLVMPLERDDPFQLQENNEDCDGLGGKYRLRQLDMILK